jgi:hypothetical protein
MRPVRDMASERRRIFVKDMPQVTPRRQQSIKLPGELLLISGDRRIATVERESRRLLIWNEELEPIQEVFLSGLPDPEPGARYERPLVLRDLTVVLLGLSRVVCVDPSGARRWNLVHPPWPRGRVGSDAVVIDDQLALAIPASLGPAPSVETAELAIVDIGNGSESRERLTDDYGDPEGFHGITRRGGQGGALDAGYGQDGSMIWRITPSATRPAVTSLGTFDRVLADLSPRGDEILTTPHSDGGLIVYRWDDLAETARLEAADVFEEDDDLTADRFDFSASFLSGDRLVSMTQQGRILLIDRVSMTVESQVVPDGFHIIGFDGRGRPVDHAEQAVGFAGDITGLTVVGENRIVVRGKDGRAELCDL